LTRLLGNSQVVFTLASSWLQVIATKHQFLEITNELLSHHKVEGDVANIIANAVWNKSRDIRDCVRIGKLARSVEDVGFVVDRFLSNDRRIDG